MHRWRARRDARVSGMVAEFIRLKAVTSIGFMYAGVMVSKHSWNGLADMMEADPPEVHVEVNRKLIRQKKVGGFYDTLRNVITIRTGQPLWTARQRGIVVHECAHALQDRGRPQTEPYVGEAISEVAALWYFLNTRKPDLSGDERRAMNVVAGIRERTLASQHGSLAVVKSDERKLLEEYTYKRWSKHYEKGGVG